jgi:hypothetical protein
MAINYANPSRSPIFLPQDGSSPNHVGVIRESPLQKHRYNPDRVQKPGFYV